MTSFAIMTYIGLVFSSCLVAYGYSFSVINLGAKSTSLTKLYGEVWPGDRPPLNNMELLSQGMNAQWGRARFRTEIWNDDVNPVNDWWTAYAPSEEEIEAAKEGFDFTDVKGWCESKGLNYEEVMEKTRKLQKEKHEQFVKEREERLIFTDEEFEKTKEEYYALQRRVFEMALRVQDNKLQAAKGQPSLDATVEDTGERFKND